MKSVENEWEQTVIDASTPVTTKKTTVDNDRNSGKRWDLETTLHLLNAQTYYIVNTAANWLGSRIKESSYFLYYK